MAGLRERVADAPDFVIEATKGSGPSANGARDASRLTGIPLGKRTLHAIEHGLPEPEEGQTHRDVAVGVARNLCEAGTPKQIALFVLAHILDRVVSAQNPDRPWTSKDVRAIVNSVYREAAPDQSDYRRRSPLADRLTPVDLAERWDEEDEPEWVVEGLFLRGKFHEFVGAMGTGKSLFLLAIIVHEAFPAGLRVAYLDEENGPDEIKRRLRALGAEAEQVSEQFLYLPDVMPEIEEASDAVPMIAGLGVDLAVFDSLADFYAAANLDELSNKDATTWSKAYPEALAHDFGVATVAIDHTGHKEQGRARGATAKGAKADATWMVEVKDPFDTENTGHVKLERGRKNRQGILPASHIFKIGGDGNGGIVFRRLQGRAEDEEKAYEVARMKDFQKAVLELLEEAGEPGLSQSKLLRAVRDTGLKRTDQWMREKLAEYVESQVIPVGHRQEGQRRVYYLVDRGETRGSK